MPTTQAVGAPKVLAAPAVRERARSLGVDLWTVSGSGIDGRITHEDLDANVQRHRRASADASSHPASGTVVTPIIGLRRTIASRLTTASSRIPHITYVEEVDMTALEQLRLSMRTSYPDQHLTVLPFIMTALALALREHPAVNATYDDEAQELTTYSSVHVGVATQTDGGLIVPVVRDVESLDIWHCASEMERVTSAARTGAALRQELSGSTITITSLGALGGLVTTPIINHPEVAIIGVNKMQTRPNWNGATFVPRTMMNLSSSFDHRIIDGWAATRFVQRLKALLEEPALLFIGQPSTG